MLQANQEVSRSMRVIWGSLTLSACLAVGGFAQATAENGPIALAEIPLLFVDDHALTSSERVVRTFHPARTQSTPVIEPDRPWEGVRVYTYGSIDRAPGDDGFRLWYMSHSRVLYATSVDGVVWSKPNLELHPYEGSRANNIVAPGFHSPTVLEDRFERDPKKRYKLLGNTGGKFHAAYSADGTHWERSSKDPIFIGSDTSTLTQDPRTGEFLAFFKKRSSDVPGRVVWLTRSRDFETWSEPKLVFHADKEDNRWARNSDQLMEVYNMTVIPHAAGFVGFPTLFRVTDRVPKTTSIPGTQSRDDGPIDVQMVTSRNGDDWERTSPRLHMIPRGQPGTFDGGAILGVTSTAVHAGDETWMLYTAINTGHGGALPPKRLTIGRATWRLHGFASLDAGPEGGRLTTRLVQVRGGVIEVNADAGKGSLRAALLDAEGRPLPGFALEECEALQTNETRHRLRWRSGRALPGDRPLHIMIEMTSTRLFSLSGTVSR